MILTIFKLATWGGGLLQLWWTLFTSLILKMIFFCLLSIFFWKHTHTLIFCTSSHCFGTSSYLKKKRKIQSKKKNFWQINISSKILQHLEWQLSCAAASSVALSSWIGCWRWLCCWSSPPSRSIQMVVWHSSVRWRPWPMFDMASRERIQYTVDSQLAGCPRWCSVGSIIRHRPACSAA